MSIARLIAGKPQDIVACALAETVREAAARLADNRIGAMPVLEGESVQGVFSERDLLYCLAKHGASALDLTVAEVMTAPAITTHSGSSVRDALQVMTSRRIRHLPVIDGGRLIAFVSIGDLVKYRLELIEHEAAVMRDYIRTA